MAKISETELRRKLKKLEVDSSGGGASIEKVGDQYEYDKTVIYLAYASALSNLSSGTIPSQSDATDFQFSPYNDSGVLLAYRGYFINRSIYQSGDPTDYTWESTSGASGFTSSERYYTTSTGLLNTLGNPTKPGTDIIWTVITAGTAVPGTAVYLAERFTLTTTAGAVTSNWDITPVGKHVDTSVVSADGIKAVNMDLDGTLNVTANSGAIRWGKDDGEDVDNTGLFVGRDSSGNPRMVFGNASSYIWFDGTVISVVGADVDDSAGTDVVILTDTSTTHTYTIGPTIATISIELSGGGGGGGCGESIDGASAGAAGGTTYVYVKQSNGSVRTTFSAAGGAGGAVAAGPAGNGSAGGSFSHGSATEPPFTDAAGGAGGSGSGNGAGGATPSAGGGGAGNPNSGNDGGGGGAVGSFSSNTSYTVVNTTDYLEIVVGAGGAGGTTTRDNHAGAGARGVVRLQGAT